MTRRSYFASFTLILSLVSALTATACAAPELRLIVPDEKHSHLRAADRDALQTFAAQTLSHLPSGMGRRFHKGLAVRWDPRITRELAPAEAAKLFCAREGAAHLLGRTEIQVDGVATVYLHPALVPAAAVGDRGIPAPCSSHLDLVRLARAALIHQVAHLYAGDSETGRELEAEFKLSAKSAFLAVDAGRSPDPFEARSATEHLAVNLEYFVLDADYACRRPYESRKLRSRLGSPRGLDAKDCATDWRMSFEKGGQAEISPDQVREIRYLLVESAATPIERRTERAGHAMFHLVRCLEGDQTCDRDVVISLRSNMLDPVNETLSGFSGTEPGRVRVYRYGEIVTEYADSELRSLRSVPLALSDESRERLVALLMERYWSNNGFIVAGGRNTGIEVRDLLKATLGPGHPMWKSVAVTSARLLEDLKRAGLARTDSETRVASGWGELELAFEKLNSGAGNRWKSLKDYLQSTTARERREWAKSNLGESGNWLAQAEAFDRMEIWIRASIERRTQRESVRKLVDYRQRQMSRAEAKALFAKVGRLRSYSHELLPHHQAWDLAGYGVPLSRERDRANRAPDREFARMTLEAEEAVAALAENRRNQFPEESRELTEVASNLSWVRERIAKASSSGDSSVSTMNRVPAATPH